MPTRSREIAPADITVSEVNHDFEQTVRRIAEWYEPINRSDKLFMPIGTVQDIHRAEREGKTAIPEIVF